MNITVRSGETLRYEYADLRIGFRGKLTDGV